MIAETLTIIGTNAIYSLFGYAKNRKIEDFDPYKMLGTVLFGSIMGTVAQYQGLTGTESAVINGAVGGYAGSIIKKMWQTIFANDKPRPSRKN